ncbi:hypothetical protein B8W95_13685, partial [Staphylococcus pasteuri]
WRREREEERKKRWGRATSDERSKVPPAKSAPAFRPLCLLKGLLILDVEHVQYTLALPRKGTGLARAISQTRIRKRA